MEPGGSLPHSQEPATCPYTAPTDKDGSSEILNKQLRKAGKGWSSSSGFGEMIKNSPP